MIPIRDTIQARHSPVVNHTIIGINVVVFLIQMAQGQEMDRFVYLYGLVPARYTVSQFAAYFSTGQQLFSLLSFMFLHGGFWHILGNMWSLYIFGDNVEDRLGHTRYLIFYLLCGLVSGMAHLIVNWHSTIPTIGASGAIAGVMGAYFILFPSAKILTLIPIIIIPWLVEIPAFFFLGIWFVLQFINAAGTHGAISGIAWWAHIGGFVSGIIFLKIFQRLPHSGLADRIGPVTEKKTTHRLQVIHPSGSVNDSHLYGTVTVSPHEAQSGTRKMVSLPWGFYTRMLKVSVPSGIKEGSVLRLRGMGRQVPDGQRGDLLLKVQIR
jgi:membrane associated rhomboid family serine protease